MSLLFNFASVFIRDKNPLYGIIKFKEAFLSKFSLSTSLDTLWEEFKSVCLRCLTYVPTKNSRIGTKQPWITSHIRRLSRRKQRLYNLARHTNSSHNWDTYRHLKREVQRECHKAYNDYIGSLVDKNGAITKNLWTYQDTRSCVSGQGSHVAHKCLIYRNR